MIEPTSQPQSLPLSGVSPDEYANLSLWGRFNHWLEKRSALVLIMPAILLVLFLSLFPLVISLFLSFSRFQFVSGGFSIRFVGLANYNKLLFGSEQRRLLGDFGTASPPGFVLGVVFLLVMIVMLVQYVRSKRFSWVGLFFRLIAILFAMALAVLCIVTLGEDGIPGALVVTLIFVFAGVALQYGIGLGLALLVTQNIRGKRFFRIVFLLPMMITPVGIGFLFRMLTNTIVGPFAPLWQAAGLADFSFVETATGARIAVIIAETWQWTPFMFIILLAALESTSHEIVEAARVDGAGKWAMFRSIILPQIAPVSFTLILIRTIEAFKIIDLPNILTYGGPGTATESVTLYAYNQWRALDLGLSAAIAYLLLIVVTFVAMVYVRIIRRRVVVD
jgi:multiple sugar transport system permease protein